jgi:hypothetical protein
MKLSDCYIGQIVTQIQNSTCTEMRIGWISGLTRNCTNEVILIVNWAKPYDFKEHVINLDEDISFIHPVNVIPLSEYKI